MHPKPHTTRTAKRTDETVAPSPRLVALRCLAAVFACASLAAPAAAQRDDDVPDSAKVMSAWVVNFARFSEWPGSKFEHGKSPIIIGVLGRDDVGTALVGLGNDVAVGDRPVRVRPLAPPDLAGLDGEERLKARARFREELRRCHVLYVARSEAAASNSILSSVAGAQVLTVSSIKDFAAAGGMLNLEVRNNKVAFDANVEEINASGVTVSSKVLRLARIQKTEK